MSGACGQLSCLGHPNAGVPIVGKFPSRVRCQLQKMGCFTITMWDLRHICAMHLHKWRGPTHKPSWLAKPLVPRIVCNVKVLVKELINGLKMDYKKPWIIIKCGGAWLSLGLVSWWPKEEFPHDFVLARPAKGSWSRLHSQLVQPQG